jgi:hypothetical protein
MTDDASNVLLTVNVTLTIKFEHPLDKIFTGIPAGSLDATHASVRYYGLGPNFLDNPLYFL